MYKKVFERLSKSNFRSKFKLSKKEKEYILQKGLDTIKSHAQDFVSKRIAPAYIENDGKQTPMRNHPVFIAQHATATCCRQCINKWHGFPIKIELNKEQQEYIVNIIMHWIKNQINS